MKETKYIPGDLVKINGVVNVIDGVYPKSFSKDRIIEAHAIEGDNTNRYRYDLDFGKIISIELIPLTLEILEKNGWSTQNGWYYYLDVRKGFISCIDIDFQHKSGSGKLLVKVNNDSLLEIKYVHQLQHLLFGLGLSMDLKV